ncbi:AAA family ATPase [Halomonas sp. CUBES01]|uniref:AAA family ATPase n=1 Tax=Halomonas sp. CUBES01 TaxID=2897340 RepID=UPI001E5C2082|nr:AAA family ATPase [Halomonas sp. CUBES01]MEC4766359.1 AAA family ATPase [Halomonas sp. CUBES01]
MNYRFVVTGGPGGGKTTLLSSLSERGYSFAPESARKIIKERLAAGLLPRPEPVSFAHEVLRADIEKYRNIGANNRPTFFDRSVLDALHSKAKSAASLCFLGVGDLRALFTKRSSSNEQMGAFKFL